MSKAAEAIIVINWRQPQSFTEVILVCVVAWLVGVLGLSFIGLTADWVINKSKKRGLK